MTIETIAGQKVGLRCAGHGPDALLLHCTLGHSGAFSDLMVRLGPYFNMRAFDLPGHGQSTLLQDVDYQDQSVRIAIELLERAGRASQLIGHSFGATIALRIAVERPDLVAGLTLYEPVYFSLLCPSNLSAYLAEIENSMPFFHAATKSDWPNAARAFLTRWGAIEFDEMETQQQRYILKTLPTVLAHKDAIFVPERGAKILAELGGINVPVALIAGQNSQKVVHRILAVIKEKIPHSNLHKIKNATHMGPVTHSAELAEIIINDLPESPE